MYIFAWREINKIIINCIEVKRKKKVSLNSKLILGGKINQNNTTSRIKTKYNNYENEEMKGINKNNQFGRSL